MTAAIQIEEEDVKKLHIADNLSLPLDLVTETFSIVAKRRVGKSFTGRRIAEQLFLAGMQVVIVDPKGDHWGIRSSPNGKGPGLPFLILGGEHGDVPLQAGGGEIVAELVVKQRVSVLIDISHFRKSEVAHFMTDFGEALYRLKAHEEFRTPMMLLLDEADAVAPQRPQHGEERMLGAIEDIVRRGGQRGIGCGLITQRAAVLNKNVLTQSQLLIALRTIAPQDLKAMDAWIEVHGTPAQRKELMESLPSLPRGDAWFWSPGWPTDDGIFKRVHVLPIETFDSGATPKTGEKRVAPKVLAEVDLEKLTAAMKETVERVAANDPSKLKAKIAKLEAEVAKRQYTPPPEAKKTEVKRVDVPMLKDAQIKRLETLLVRAEKAATASEHAAGELRVAATEVESTVHLAKAQPIPPHGFTPPTAPRAGYPRDIPPAKRVMVDRPTGRFAIVARSPGEPSNMGSGERTVLTAVAQHVGGVTRQQITVLTGYKASTRNTYLQRLQARGFIEASSEPITATTAGIGALGADYQPLPTGAALLDHWRATLPAGERAVLEVAVTHYPEPVSRDQVTIVTGFKTSTRNTYLQRLRARHLVTESGRDAVRASETLFQ